MEQNIIPTPTLSPCGADQPLLLLAVSHQPQQDSAVQEQELRRMGLMPEAVDEALTYFAGQATGQVWKIRFGQRAFLTAQIDSDYWLPHWLGTDVEVAGSRPNLTANYGAMLALAPLAGTVIAPEDSDIASTRALLKVATLLADMTGASHIFWSPARLWSEIPAFRSAVTEMLDSGMPPLLHLVAFVDGQGGQYLETRGLSYFCGQELRLIDAGNLSRTEQVRRLARLSLDMMMNGAIAVPRRFPGLGAGESIAVAPGGAESGGASVLVVRIEQE